MDYSSIFKSEKLADLKPTATTPAPEPLPEPVVKQEKPTPFEIDLGVK